MIRTESLTRTFTTGKQSVEAVRGIDLTVDRGELVAVLGPNGAGKSTTLRMLTTLLTPSSGRAQVCGVDVVADPPGVRSRIGYVGQKDGAGHNYRVLDELLMQARFYGLDRATARSRAGELLSTLDLDGMQMRKVSTMSGGQRRRLDIALGLVHGPQLLFLDEPTTGMDPQSRANLWDHITRLRRDNGTTIVLTTHYLEEADSMAERVVVIDHGSVIADDSPAALKDRLAGDRITLVVESAAAQQVRAAVERIGTELQESDVTLDGGAPGRRISMRVSAGDRLLPDLLGRLAAAGVAVRSATLKQPTLDDVFLTLTGRSLREGADA